MKNELCHEKRIELFKIIANGKKIPIIPKVIRYTSKIGSSRGFRVHILNQFLKLGLIQREKDTKDMRRYLWTLTEKGEKIWKELFPIINSFD